MGTHSTMVGDCSIILPVQFLNRRVIGVLVRDKEGGLRRAAIRINVVPGKDLLVNGHVGSGDGAVERDGDHLRHLADVVDVARDDGAIDGAVAVGQLALGGVATTRTVWVLRHAAGIFVAAVATVRLTVAKSVRKNTLAHTFECNITCSRTIHIPELVHTGSISALELTVGADGLLSVQVGLGLARLRQNVAVVHVGLAKANRSILPTYFLH